MSDHRADAAVIDCVVGIGVEERRLQNSSRENNLIHVRVVIGIHRRRCHSPFGAIHWLADFLELAINFKVLGSDRVENVGSSVDLEQ